MAAGCWRLWFILLNGGGPRRMLRILNVRMIICLWR